MRPQWWVEVEVVVVVAVAVVMVSLGIVLCIQILGFLFIENVFQTFLRTDGQMDGWTDHIEM